MTEATLFDVSPPLAQRSDPETSKAAARSIGRGAEAAILACFPYEMSTRTDDEIARALPKLHPPTVKSARSRLTKAGLLVDSGRRRPSERGRDQIAWRKA